MPLNYSKWDNFVDSDDEDLPVIKPIHPKGEKPPSEGGRGSVQGEKGQATVTAAFIVRTVARTNNVPVYLNICSSPSVPGGGMTAFPDSNNGLSANMPYICGDIRQDNDGEADCYVLEFIFAPDTLKQATDNKQACEVCIRTALAVVSQQHEILKVDPDGWQLYAPDALKEVSGAHFFAPGKMLRSKQSAEEPME